MASIPAPPGSSIHRSTGWWLVALVFAVFLMRFIALTADPSFDGEVAFIYDWGQWWRNARLHALTGQWRLDDYNAGLFVAPGYTMAVRLMFALFGVGLRQALLVNVLAGTACVVLVWRFAREAGERAALMALLLMGFNRFTIAYARSAFPESFQLLFVVAAMGAIAWRGRSPWVSAAGGLALALSLFVKVTGALCLPIAAAGWMARLYLDRREGLPLRDGVRAAAVYGGAAVMGLALLVLLLLPIRHEFGQQFSWMSIGQFDPVGPGARPNRVPLLFAPLLGFVQNRFFVLEWYLLAGVGLMAAGRIAGILRQPVTRAEAVCWAWLGIGTLYLSRLYYQPERRFLILVPPMVVLTAHLLGRDLRIDAPRARTALQTLLVALAGALPGWLAAFYGAYLLAPRISYAAGMSYSTVGAVLVTGGAITGALVALAVRPLLREATLARRHWILAVVLAQLALAHWSLDMARRTYTMVRISETIGRLADGWAAAGRYLDGGTAETLAMGTGLIGVGPEVTGPNSAQRFRPSLFVYSLPLTRAVQPIYFGPPAADLPHRAECAAFPLRYEAGRPWYLVHLFVNADLQEECRARLAAMGQATVASGTPR